MLWQIGLLIVLIAIVATWIILFVRTKPPAPVADTDPMTRRQRMMISWYLLGVAVVIMIGIVQLFSVTFEPEAGKVPAFVESERPKEKDVPSIKQLDPA